MATINLGAIKFNWRGAYNNATAYAVDDVVSSGGSSYICILASTGNAVSNGTYWQQMSAAGTNGTDLTTTLTTQGDILYRDGSGLQRLGAGTNGQALITGGTGANPSWGTIATGLVGFAHSVRGSTSTLNTTSYTNLHTLNYTPTDYANNRVLVFAHGAVRQDDGNGAGAFVRLTASGNHSTTLYNDIGIGIDSTDGQNYHNISIIFEDTNLTSNNQVSYTIAGRTDNVSSDFRPQPTLGLTVFEIGV